MGTAPIQPGCRPILACREYQGKDRTVLGESTRAKPPAAMQSEGLDQRNMGTKLSGLTR